MTPLCKLVNIHGLYGWKANPLTRLLFDSNFVNIAWTTLRVSRFPLTETLRVTPDYMYGSNQGGALTGYNSTIFDPRDAQILLGSQ